MVGGADGCPGGWVAVWLDSEGGLCARVYGSAGALMAEPWTVLGIDVPIGLRSVGDPLATEPREVDRLARRVLGGGRASSVFPAPLRETAGLGRAAASELTRAATGRGVGAQHFAIYAKAHEVDGLLRADPGLAERVFEVHPEVSFAVLSEGRGLVESKRSEAGRAVRQGLVEQVFGPGAFGAVRGQVGRREAGDDDVLDALAVLWSAGRVAAGSARSLPDPPEIDSAGLRMAIFA